MSWEAIRALPKPIVGENEWWDFFDGDLFMAPSEQPRFWQVLQAAHEAQALLKEHDRAVELLRMAIENEDRDPANGCSMRDYENWLSKVRAILRELEGSDRDHERANETGKIEENK